jgi:hypothetical protein
VLTKGAKPLVDLGRWNFGWDDLMIGAVGHVVLFVVGLIASQFFAPTNVEAGLGRHTRSDALGNAASGCCVL